CTDRKMRNVCVIDCDSVFHIISKSAHASPQNYCKFRNQTCLLLKKFQCFVYLTTGGALIGHSFASSLNRLDNVLRVQDLPYIVNYEQPDRIMNFPQRTLELPCAVRK